MTIHFDCTMCGRCCHSLRLPLTVSEAVQWLGRGGTVQLFSEAIPWPEEPGQDNLPAQHKRRRSFAAMSGTLPVRVVVTLVASFDGPCPNLLPNMMCGAYEVRPLICRIYPAEINPFVELDPKGKACPPEAWTVDKPPFAVDGRPLDARTRSLIDQSRNTDVADVDTKKRLCVLLGHSVAALSNEGIAVFSPASDDLVAALAVLSEPSAPAFAGDADWALMSNRSSTMKTLISIDAKTAPVNGPATRSLEYLGFFPDE